MGGGCGGGRCQSKPAAAATSSAGCCVQQQQEQQQPGESQGQTAPSEAGGTAVAGGCFRAAESGLSTQDGMRQEQQQEQQRSEQGCGLGSCNGAGAGCAAAGSGEAASTRAGAGEGASEGPGPTSTTTSNPTTATNATTSMAGLSWELPPGASRDDCLYVWVGPCGSGGSSSSAQQVLQLTHNAADWLSYDPAAPDGGVAGGLSDETRRLLKRRNFMVEKTRQANIVGILVGSGCGAGMGYIESLTSRQRVSLSAMAGQHCGPSWWVLRVPSGVGLYVELVGYGLNRLARGMGGVADAVRDAGNVSLIQVQAYRYRIRRQGLARQSKLAAGRWP